MTMNSNVVCPDSLQMDGPFVMEVANQIRSFCGAGLCCDSILAVMVQAAEPWRYDSGLWTFEMQATAHPAGGGGLLPANTDGDNLTLAGQEILLLNSGGIPANEPIVLSNGGTWYNKTISDSDLFRRGAPVSRNYLFMVIGLTVEFSEAFQRGGTNVDATDPKFYSAWLRNRADGPMYCAQLQKALLDQMALRITFSDAGKFFILGRAANYPQLGGASGFSAITNGKTSAGSVFTPLNAALMLGSFDDSNQATLSCLIGQPTVVQSDAVSKTIAGSAAGTAFTINAANVGTVYIEMTVTFIGHAVVSCPPDCCTPK